MVPPVPPVQPPVPQPRVDSWSVKTEADVAAALGAAMPGDHPVEKVALLSRVVQQQRVDSPAVPSTHIEVLENALDLGMLRDVVAPWKVPSSVRTALVSRGVRVLKGQLSDVRDPLAPGFHEASSRAAAR